MPIKSYERRGSLAADSELMRRVVGDSPGAGATSTRLEGHSSMEMLSTRVEVSERRSQ